MANTKIPSELIADSSITAAKLADGTITTADIADSNVTTAKIADSNVTTAKIGDAQVTTAKITDANVTTGKIADDAVTTAKMASNSVTSDTLASGLTLAGNTAVTGVLTVNTNAATDVLVLRRNAADGDAGVQFANSSGNLTVIRGSSAGDFTIDTAGNIVLDADGGDIKFEDGGVETLRYSSSASGPQFFSPVADKDIIFKGKDGSSTITALTLDMSGAGEAIFNAGATLGGDLSMGSNQIIFDNNSQAILIKDAAGTASYVLYQDNADTLVVGNGTNVEKIRLDTSGNEGALVVDTNGNVGIGDDNPSEKFVVKGDGARIIVSSADMEVAMLGRAGSSGSALDQGYLRLRNQGVTADGVVINSAGSSWLNGGNVGIGTTSPAKLLNLQDNSDPTIMLTKQYSSTTGSIGSIVFGNGNWDSSMASIRGIQDGTNDGGKLEFKTQADSSGGEVTRLTIFRTGLSTFNGPASSVNLGGGSTGSSALYVNSTSGHTGEMLQILKNGSTRMEMSNAGKLGIGISGGSISSKLHVRGTQSNTISTANSFAAFDGNGGDGVIIGARTSSPFEAYIQSGYTPNIGTSHHYPLVLNPNGGNVGIGALNPSDKLEVSGTGGTRLKVTNTNTNWAALDLQAGGNQANYIFFRDDSAERARITVLDSDTLSIHIGSGTGEKLRIANTEMNTFGSSYGSGQGIRQRNIGDLALTRNSSSSGNESILINNTNNANIIGIMQYRSNNSVQGQYLVGSSSGITFTGSSDYRYKTNINTLNTSSLDKIAQLRLVSYNWNEESNMPTDEQQIGVIAHELHEVFPEFVSGEYDAVFTQEEVDEKGDTAEAGAGDIKPQTVSLLNKDMIIHILKAIQEQQTKNDALEARLDEAGL